MKIVIAYPPMIEEIDRKFRVRGKPYLFAWGDTIYNPNGGVVTPFLVKHEEVHGRRQLKMGVESWWHKYIEDTQFRLDEELPAHKAEYWCLCRGCGIDAKQHHLEQVAKRLAAPMYGSMVSVEDAMRMLRV